MLESGLDVRKVITHRLPAEKFLEGFEIMRGGESGKIVLDWAAGYVLISGVQLLGYIRNARVAPGCIRAKASSDGQYI